MEALTVIGLWVAILAAYFAPALIAGHKGKKNTARIFALDLLLGWTVVGWIGALIWALGDD